MTIPDDSVKSYQWWREHGTEWPEEIRKRRATQIIYTLQECFLQAYLGALAPAKILEFGCGFGRHLKYLAETRGLDCYGCDQSPSMLATLLQWAPEKWMTERIRLVEPLQQLPYKDKSFDVVFTTSVLIHIAPAHLNRVLAELVRVARHEIIHIENNRVKQTVISSPEHDGCWMHPVIAAYDEIGVPGEVLPKGCLEQDIYRLTLEPMARNTEGVERLLPKLAEIDRLWRTLAN